MSAADLTLPPPAEGSAEVGRRVAAARQLQADRYNGHGPRTNAEADGELLGGLTLGMVRRGVSQAATLGYWMGAEHAGRGTMTAAVRLAMSYAFETLRLRRIEAACVPTNAASRRVLERVGFRQEGYARQYLCINGSWQDHILFALLRDEFRFDTGSP